MNDTTLDLLNRLADKLGTTVEHLWGVLIKQAPITAISDLVIGAVLVVLTVVWYRFVRAKTKVPPRTPENAYPSAAWDDDSATFAWVFVVITGLIALMWCVAAMQQAVTAFVNPGYWALKQLIPS